MTKKVIGGRTIKALEQIQELMDEDNEEDEEDEEDEPNLTLTDACIDLVDSYNGDTTEDDLNSLLHNLQVGVETAIKPDQDASWLVNAANAVIRYFDGADKKPNTTDRP